jgi:hypothetical protein
MILVSSLMAAFVPGDYSEQRSIAGLAYYCYANDTALAVDSSRIVGFTMPETGIYMLDVDIVASNLARIQIFEGCTLAGATDTLTVFNNARFVSSVPIIYPRYRPTVSYAGTEMLEYFTGGSVLQRKIVLLLEPGENYCIKVTSMATNTDVSIILRFYRRD